jgi:hypothetical protein
MKNLSIVDQVVECMKPRNRIASFCGAFFGGIIPLGVYIISHYELSKNPWMWVLVIGGLAYSALTVFDWAVMAFKHKTKAFGFVVLLEGVMTFSGTGWLSIVYLMALMVVNSVAAGSSIALDRREKNKRKK